MFRNGTRSVHVVFNQQFEAFPTSRTFAEKWKSPIVTRDPPDTIYLNDLTADASSSFTSKTV